MDNRIFIIHSSEIIRQGLSRIVKDLFDITSVLLESPEKIKNYTSIAQSRILILAEAQKDQKHLVNYIQFVDKNNSVKTVSIRESKDQINCDDSCDCCLSVMDNSARISDLLKSHLHFKDIGEDKKTSHWLSEREIEVVKLVAIGKTNKEIAGELFISFHTVISHRKNITEKLGIKSISGLTVYAVLNKLIDASTMDLE